RCRRRKVEPHMRLHKVWRDFHAVGVRQAEIDLRPGITLIGSAAPAFYRFGVVLRHSHAPVVHIAERVLRPRIALVRSDAIPLYRFGVVLPKDRAHSAMIRIVRWVEIVIWDDIPTILR